MGSVGVGAGGAGTVGAGTVGTGTVGTGTGGGGSVGGGGKVAVGNVGTSSAEAGAVTPTATPSAASRTSTKGRRRFIHRPNARTLPKVSHQIACARERP